MYVSPFPPTLRLRVTVLCDWSLSLTCRCSINGICKSISLKFYSGCQKARKNSIYSLYNVSVKGV